MLMPTVDPPTAKLGQTAHELTTLSIPHAYYEYMLCYRDSIYKPSQSVWAQTLCRTLTQSMAGQALHNPALYALQLINNAKSHSSGHHTERAAVSDSIIKRMYSS